MHSNFSGIGITVESVEDMQRLVDRIADDADYLEVSGGVYLVWQAGDGPELWLQCDREDNVIGLSPHFAGATRMRLGLVAPIERPGQTPLDGSYYAWANPPAGDAETGDYPLVFDCPDAAVHAGLELPAAATVQLAAFAHHLTTWDSAEAYDRERARDEDSLSSRSFIPAGLLRASDEDERPPIAYAIVTGHVLRAEQRVNPISGARYQWAEVATHGGSLDLVVDAALVPDGLAPGAVVSGGCWISGQIVLDDA